MPRVKILKTDIEDNDIPAVCMICGEKPADIQEPTKVGLSSMPLAVLGLIGRLINPRKISMSVLCCHDCKAGYRYEVNMGLIWDSLRTVALLSFVYMIAVQPQGLPKNLMFPAIAWISTMLLETVYFFTIGRKNAIRVVAVDKNSVSLDLPNGKWGVSYTTHKREKTQRRGSTLPPGPPASLLPSAPNSMPTAPVLPPSPAAAPATMAPPLPTPTPPVAAQPSSAGKPYPLDGDDLAFIPEELPEFLQAVKMGDSDLLEEVIKKGGNLKESLPNGMNGLHLAAVAGLMQMADFLIKHGLPVNCEMNKGLTPMHLAVQSNNQNIVGLLLAKKGNPNHRNAQGQTTLHWCAAVQDSRLDQSNRYKMAKMLTQGGGDLEARDNNGHTPAELARLVGDEKVAEAFS